MGEYLGRIHDEVKQRPHYVVRETVGWMDASHGQPVGTASAPALRGVDE
jgi:hypothetical protein